MSEPYVVRRLSLDEFLAELKAQGVPRRHLAFKCPMCGTVQSMDTLISAGAGPDENAVEPFIGFSCVGRWTKAGSPRTKPDGKPCNWTLGGLFHTHRLEVQTKDGKTHPRFEVATAGEARSLMESGAGGAFVRCLHCVHGFAEDNSHPTERRLKECEFCGGTGRIAKPMKSKDHV